MNNISKEIFAIVPGIICRFSSMYECLVSVRAGGAREFINVPQYLQTEEMCLRAVFDDPNMLSYIRSDLVTSSVKEEINRVNMLRTGRW